MQNLKRPFTPQTRLRSASNFGKTLFRRFPTFNFSIPNFFFGCVFRFVPVSKLPKNWKLPILEELGIFRHHRRVRHEKWPPMKRFSSLYDSWRRGKRWHYDFFLDFWPTIIFTISRKWCCITKLRSSQNLLTSTARGMYWGVLPVNVLTRAERSIEGVSFVRRCRGQDAHWSLLWI